MICFKLNFKVSKLGYFNFVSQHRFCEALYNVRLSLTRKSLNESSSVFQGVIINVRRITAKQYHITVLIQMLYLILEDFVGLCFCCEGECISDV